jgi:ADP-ribose pyrophosphatase YjhB (NUDIX family)
MRKKKRRYCIHCGRSVVKRDEDGIPRDYCDACDVFFYDNPLPVVSTILQEDRRILLVRRKFRPYKGMWCLPSGFAEVDESIEDAAMRELEEETGVKGKIVSLVDVDSCSNYFYGDLIFLTFEAVQEGGGLAPGSDTVAVKYYPIEKIPRLAFESNMKAVRTFIQNKSDYWAIVDSFSAAVDKHDGRKQKKNLLSDRLVETIRENAGIIVANWLHDVSMNRSTPTYRSCEPDRLSRRAYDVLWLFSTWAGEFYKDGAQRRVDIRGYFIGFGKEKRKEGFTLHEVLSALSLKRKHIWEFALSHGISKKPLDIYMAFEFDRRMMIFFDRATFYVSMGYMEA